MDNDTAESLGDDLTDGGDSLVEPVRLYHFLKNDADSRNGTAPGASNKIMRIITDLATASDGQSVNRHHVHSLFKCK